MAGVKTNTGLVAYAKAQLGKPYWYGTFGQTASEALYKDKSRQYAKEGYYNQKNYKVRFDTQYGQRVHDCAGLIKGYLFSDTPTSTPKFDASLDKGSTGMLNSCREKGKIDTIPDLPGVLVFYSGHVGVYIGGGYVIEARGHDFGVVKTALKSRPWTHWGKHPAITYITLQNTSAAAAETQKPLVPKAGQAVQITGAKLYASASSSIPARTVSGTYYLYDGQLLGGRYRITNKPANVGKKPAFLYVTGWIGKGDV